jgi:hypothetical protein
MKFTMIVILSELVPSLAAFLIPPRNPAILGFVGNHCVETDQSQNQEESKGESWVLVKPALPYVVLRILPCLKTLADKRLDWKVFLSHFTTLFQLASSQNTHPHSERGGLGCLFHPLLNQQC